MKLYGYWRSSCTWRVRIALAYKGLAWDTAPVHLVRGGGEQRSPEYRAQNPMGQVPLLVIGEGSTPLLLTQSLAIIEYLDETQPEPPLLPSDAVGRARVRLLAEIINSGIQPLQNLPLLGAIERFADKATSQAWGRDVIAHGLTALEAHARHWAGSSLYGDAPSVADVCLVPQLYNARRFGVDLSAFPTLLRVEAALTALAAFNSTHPDHQPDAEA